MPRTSFMIASSATRASKSFGSECTRLLNSTASARLDAATMRLAAVPFAQTLLSSRYHVLVGRRCQLARCFNNYSVPSDYYTLESYTEAQPNESQLQVSNTSLRSSTHGFPM
ncbi:hypothetical protein BDZ89DRAFT_793431 [Hymenopellis radicata]|nr:hypothetical protein BDZ89DRAFT_793431 [Hymenopellis radicata]